MAANFSLKNHIRNTDHVNRAAADMPKRFLLGMKGLQCFSM
jgi:hypothetical protein